MEKTPSRWQSWQQYLPRGSPADGSEDYTEAPHACIVVNCLQSAGQVVASGHVAGRRGEDGKEPLREV